MIITVIEMISQHGKNLRILLITVILKPFNKVHAYFLIETCLCMYAIFQRLKSVKKSVVVYLLFIPVFMTIICNLHVRIYY